MTDREMLELAARAAGYVVESHHVSGGAWVYPVDEVPNADGDYPGLFLWNPLYTHPPRYVGDARKHVICVCPDCVATNYRGWRETVHDELVTTWTLSAENKDDPRKALQDIINWHVRVALDPAVSSDAQALIERGKAMRDGWRPASEPPEDGRDVVVWCAQERRAVHGMYVRRHPPVVGLVDGWVAPDASELTHWRDVTPPTESTIAAKCQRIEGSGEICGLTPPCPDCGSSLIDVAEGA